MHRFDSTEQRLINEFQHAFPMVARPYQAIGEQLGLAESAVLECFQSLQAAGVVSRVGPVFSPGRVGCSTLAALAVPVADFEATARWISALPETNHNYEREDTYNLWFVITASDDAHLQAIIGRIRDKYTYPMLVLPLLEQFHIDLGFDLTATEASAKTAYPSATTRSEPLSLTTDQRDVISQLQHGLPLVSEPYAVLWPDDPAKAQFAIEQLDAWQRGGVIKRFGVIVRHHELGYKENAMVVWDIPDDRVSTLAREMAATPAVTLCYRRPRQLPTWPYNLFCMIHGKDRATVHAAIAKLCDSVALTPYPMNVLFSKRRFKQRGARYVFDGRD